MTLQFFVRMIHKLHNDILCSKTSRNSSTIGIVANEFANIVTCYCLNFFVVACCQCNEELVAVKGGGVATIVSKEKLEKIYK